MGNKDWKGEGKGQDDTVKARENRDMSEFSYVYQSFLKTDFQTNFLYKNYMKHLEFHIRYHFVRMLLSCYLQYSKKEIKKIMNYWFRHSSSVTIPPR